MRSSETWRRRSPGCSFSYTLGTTCAGCTGSVIGRRQIRPSRFAKGEMNEVIRNLGPVIGVWLIALLGWWDIRRMRRKRPPRDE